MLAEATKATTKYAPGSTERDVLRGTKQAADAFLAVDRAAAEYARIREIFVAFVGGGGYGDAIAGRRGRVLSEVRKDEHPDGQLFAYVADPDGYVIEL